MRGERIAITAGARSGLDGDAAGARSGLDGDAVYFLRSTRGQPGYMKDLDLDALVYGAVVATAALGPIRESQGAISEDQDPWWIGPFAWSLEDPIVLPMPVPCRGRQKLWELPKDVLVRVIEGEAAARAWRSTCRTTS